MLFVFCVFDLFFIQKKFNLMFCFFSFGTNQRFLVQFMVKSMILGQPDRFGFRSIDLGHVWFSAILIKVFFFFYLRACLAKTSLGLFW
jgi:hypothetical protein